MWLGSASILLALAGMLPASFRAGVHPHTKNHFRIVKPPHDINDGISAKTNQIFQFPSKIPANSDVTGEHNLVGDLEPYGCLLLTSTRINRSQIQIESVENRVAVRWFAFLDDFAV
jgi:hypothetical protein